MGPIAHKYCLEKNVFKYLGGMGKRDPSIVLRKTCLYVANIHNIIYNVSIKTG